MAGLSGLNLSSARAASTTPVVLPGKTAPTVAHTLVTKITEADEGVWEERDKDLALFKVPDIASPNVDVTKDLRTEDHTGFQQFTAST